MKEGLDRNEAIHAVGSVLGEQIYITMSGSSSGADINEQYVRKLKALTAEGWLSSGQQALSTSQMDAFLRPFSYHRNLK